MTTTTAPHTTPAQRLAAFAQQRAVRNHRLAVVALDRADVAQFSAEFIAKRQAELADATREMQAARAAYRKTKGAGG